MRDVDDLRVGEQRLVECFAMCVICSHWWQLMMPVMIIEVDGIAVPDVPDKVECPSCGGMYGEPEI